MPAHASSDAVVSPEAALFISPAVNFDYKAGIAVFVIRDGETGEVKAQYPSQKVVEEYIRHGAASQDAPAPDTASATSAQDGAPAVDPAVAVAPVPVAPAPIAAPPAPVASRADQVA
ncbi:hypothetical protein [Paramagnetospirillum marisnigri]|uniref:hypothetical protein n=1 Tax=Paramagnetospirillum marisnigri TaxID=1285242 RepID=UPI0012E72D69|nr:hypothetical protein [Paramagnetospirillum marisnigri]